ncbi:hypothetical protein PLESTB_000443600 [Pleodorina starrii]|uniref:Iron permease FTR1 n=1 Tax=Pleodorina starrii TaxID=330485 RepID=A0A9W6BES8_9CHLO|nr:hypothetical protein PLESTM_000677300 [Pleodorina starrii]GLC50891.1 hypothetical protein PLESTB_000443600 [Pleodorina starrii]GLC73915.1 hypothetical protein PLESTF_001437000 [Pleodorina starrii]
MASLDQYFSVVALFILFRETIEASIICGVLLQFLNRSKPALKKAVWWGVAGGVGVSIIFGVVFIAIFYTAKNSLFAGKNRDWFKGIISWIAGFLITILGFAMLRFLGWENKWKRKLAAAIAKKVPEAVAPIEGTDSDPAVQPAADSVQPAADTDAKLPPASAVPSAAGVAPRLSGSDSDDASRPPAPEPQSRGSASAAALVQQQPSLLTSPTLTSTSSSSGSAAAAAAKKGGDAAADAAAAKKGDEKAVDVGDVEAAMALDLTPADAADAAAAEEDPTDYTPATRKENFNIWILVFTTVVREGIESVVFLGGLGNVKLSAVPLPAFVGILAGCLVGMFLYYTGRQVKHIKWLVIIMAIIIFFIAAGQINLGTDALMRAGAFGYCSPWLDERPWYMIPMYDWSACCADTDPKGNEPTAVQNRKRFFALARAIFGFQDKGTPVEVISYGCYWGLVFIVMAWKAWRGTLLDADYKHTREVKRAEKEARARAAAEEAALAEEAAAVAALEGGEAPKVVEMAVVGEKAAEAGPVARLASGWRSCGGGGCRLCFGGAKGR